MEKSMLGISIKDRKRASQIRKVKDIKGQSWKYVEHVARGEDNRVNKRMTDWTKREGKKNSRRPDKRWKNLVRVDVAEVEAMVNVYFRTSINFNTTFSFIYLLLWFILFIYGC